MKVQFVYINTDSEYGEFHPGIGSLSAVLKLEGHEVDLIHLKARDKPRLVERTMSDVKKFKPDIIGFSLTELQGKYLGMLTKHLKEEFGIPIIVGGPYATVCPDNVINLDGVDMVVRGEGENVLKTLLHNIEHNKPINKIKGLWVKDRKEEKIHKNPLDNPLDIDSLPFPDRSIFDDETITWDKFDGVTQLKIICNRGCPFNCSYCINKSLRSIYPKGAKYVRSHSVDYIIEEITNLQGKYKFGAIGFYDDIMFLDKKWTEEFSKKYKEEINLPFYVSTRPETCNNEILSTISRARCKELHMGVECGNEYIRKIILNRHVSNIQITRAFRQAKKYGLRTVSLNMIGIPYETVKNIKETIKLNTKLNPDLIQVAIFYPFRGTELGDLCYSKGWVVEERKEKIESLFDGSVLDYPQLTTEKINYYYKSFYTFYCKYNYRIRMRGMLSETLKKFHLYKIIHPLWVKYVK